ncbi:hypothetical protein J7438_00280 [Thalassotalea sp. G20_0]|nr:hypothetical protein [Thalassotalea sp. G20_0]
MAKASTKYKKSDKGKETNARASAKYEKSAKGRETRARYAASDRYKMKSAIKLARYRAYQSAIKKGMSEALALKVAKSAANKKLAEFSTTSPSLPVSQKDDEIHTAQIEQHYPLHKRSTISGHEAVGLSLLDIWSNQTCMGIPQNP